MADERRESLPLPALKRPRLDETTFGQPETVSLKGFGVGPEFRNDLDSPGVVYEVSSSSDPPNDDCGGDSGFHELTSAPGTMGKSFKTMEDGECHQSSGEEEECEQDHVPEADSSGGGQANANEPLSSSSMSDTTEQTNFRNSLLMLSKKQEDDEDEDDDRDDVASTISDISGLSDLSDLSGQDWKPISGPVSWVQQQMSQGRDPRSILHDLVPDGTLIPPHLDEVTLWKIIVNILSEPPRRRKLTHVNTLDDFLHLLQTSKNILVLTGAGVSVSSGIPDFRSRNGIYARLSKDFPDLPDPQAMFDIHYFRRDPRPFFKFAKEIYPGQFEPSISHRFIRCLEQKGKLLRNYSQNIDTLEQAAGIKKVITCHGSFATASCTLCHYTVDSTVIKDDIFHQCIPYCPKCCATGSTEMEEEMAVMKPNIVFFGEGLSDEFHHAMAQDKDKCDLLIVMGSSLKVRPVALIPSSIPADVPQILINREPLNHLTFDIELLGDCDVIIQEICNRLGQGWSHLCGSTIDNSIQEVSSRQCPDIFPNNNNHHKDCVPDTTTSKGWTSSSAGDSAHGCNGFAQGDLHNTERPDTTRPELANVRASLSLKNGERQKRPVQLPGGSHYFVSPNRYIFYGAEVSTECDSELDSCHSDENTTDPESDLSADCHRHRHDLMDGQSGSQENRKTLDSAICHSNIGCSLSTDNNRQ